MKLIASVLLFCFAWSFIAMAQAPSPSPVAVQSAAPAIVAAQPAAPSGGIMGFINAHGGFQGAVLLLVGSALALLSAVRQVLYKFDGLDLNQPVPPQFANLSVINKICYYLGTVVDFLTGNTQHS